MRDSEVKKLIGMIATGVFIFVILSRYVGRELAWSYISNGTVIIPYAITGVICWMVGLSTREWGKTIFGGVTVILVLRTLGII